MRIGTAVFLLVVILISFGYVLSDDNHVRKDLRDASGEIENLNLQVADTNQKLNSCQEQIHQNQQTISQQKADITLLTDRVAAREIEIKSLKAVISQQTGRMTELENALEKSQDENDQLRKAQTSEAGLLVNPLLAAAVLMTQIVLVAVQKRRRMKADTHLPLHDPQEKHHYVRLSPEEVAKIVHMRREKKLL